VVDEREALDDDEILQVARAGFSTADRVTDLSGRGVGIDAVCPHPRHWADGRAAHRSGTGTSFSLRLPVTLAVIPALMARVGDEAYALPLTHVTETLQLTRGLVRTVRGRDVIVIRGEVLPLLHLRDVVGCARGDAATSHVVLLRVADRTAGLVVDQLLDGKKSSKPFDAVRRGDVLQRATIRATDLRSEVSSLL
jgi:two-component system chemotaxis sensor kinase CheA